MTMATVCGRHTYAAVTRAARVFAGRLAAAGVTRGDKVVLWGENCPEWIVCYWGAVISGVIVVPIDYRASYDFLVKVASIVQARVVVVGEDTALAKTAPGGTHGGAADAIELPDAATARVWRFGDVAWSGDAPMPAVEVSRDDLVQIVFTSGATAEPKGVVIRHRNVLANVVPVEREVLKYKKYARPFLPLRFLNLLPLSHMFGQSMATNIPPMVDGTVVFMRSFNPHDIARIVKTWRVSVVVCVPKILEVLKEHALRVDPSADEHPREAAVDSGALVALSACAPHARAEVLGVRGRRGAAAVSARRLLETPRLRRHSRLRPHRDRADRHAESPVQDDERVGRHADRRRRSEDRRRRRDPRARRERHDGILRRAGAPGAMGSTGRQVQVRRVRRVQCAVARCASDADGWLHTGDIGEIDAENRVFIKGRKKEMIVTPEGLNVFPDDVERVVNAQPGVRGVGGGRPTSPAARSACTR